MQVIAKYSLKSTITPANLSANQSSIFLNPTVIPDAENLTKDQANTVELLKNNHFDTSCIQYSTAIDYKTQYLATS